MEERVILLRSHNSLSEERSPSSQAKKGFKDYSYASRIVQKEKVVSTPNRIVFAEGT